MENFSRIIIFIFLFCSGSLQAQYSWDWRDPVDLNVVDFADNKLLLYNLAAMAVSVPMTSGTDWDASSQWQVFMDYTKEYRIAPLSRLYAVRLRKHWRPRRFLSLGTDVSLLYVSDDEVEAAGIGMYGSFSWKIINTRRIHLSYDNGVGPNLFSGVYPAGGTPFNFTTYYGLTMALCLRSGNWISLGIRNMHISNADIKGRSRNPPMDGYGFFFGYAGPN